jgi:MoxR-like ATPase
MRNSRPGLDSDSSHLLLTGESKGRAVADVGGIARKVIGNVERAIVGKRQQLILSLVAWLCEGHILLEDVPGVAKTMLARALARSVGCSFKRIQCTPDLLPTDVTGASIFNQKTVEFEFRPGPLFAQVVLADEINRATPRTQAALLEAMAESRVTVDGVTHRRGPRSWSSLRRTRSITKGRSRCPRPSSTAS